MANIIKKESIENILASFLALPNVANFESQLNFAVRDLAETGVLVSFHFTDKGWTCELWNKEYKRLYPKSAKYYDDFRKSFKETLKDFANELEYI